MAPALHSCPPGPLAAAVAGRLGAPHGQPASRPMEDLAKAGDAGATWIWATAIAAVAIGITNLVMAFSPHVVVPGGAPAAGRASPAR
jgi:predicted NBD/HSP70 family sugar kinase